MTSCVHQWTLCSPYTCILHVHVHNIHIHCMVTFIAMQIPNVCVHVHRYTVSVLWNSCSREQFSFIPVLQTSGPDALCMVHSEDIWFNSCMCPGVGPQSSCAVLLNQLRNHTTSVHWGEEFSCYMIIVTSVNNNFHFHYLMQGVYCTCLLH